MMVGRIPGEKTISKDLEDFNNSVGCNYLSSCSLNLIQNSPDFRVQSGCPQTANMAKPRIE